MYSELLNSIGLDKSKQHTLSTIKPSLKLKLVLRALKSTRPLGVLCIVFGLMAMSGYILNIESFYRPIPGGAATNPLTALCVIFLGVGLAFSRVFCHCLIQRITGLIVIVVVGIRLFDVKFATATTTVITPFRESVAADLAKGISNAMGINSALMMLCVALALVLSSWSRTRWAQLAAFIALAIPMLSLTGYIYQLEHFYGEMSLTTTMIGFFLSIGAMSMTAHRGALRAVLSPYIGGRLARRQIALGFLIPLFLGWLTLNFLSPGPASSEYGLFVVLISWFILSLTCVSAIVQEHIDLRRRTMEHALAYAAMFDPLTSLPNRRRFMDMGEREMQRVARNKHALWVLMLDLDYFKRVNDIGGHTMGDIVLRQFSTELAKSVRVTDLAARLGGEEFAILLTDSDSEGAARVAEIIHERVNTMNIPGWTNEHGPITVSIGCAGSEGKSELKDILKAADILLYQAKSQGRDQTVSE